MIRFISSDKQTQGILLMVAGMVILPMLDACAKWLGQTLPATQVSAGRFILQMALLLPFLYTLGYRVTRRSFSFAQAARVDSTANDSGVGNH